MNGEAQKLYDQLQLLVAGHDSGAVVNVLLNGLSSALIQSFDCVEEAEESVEQCLAALKADMRENWDRVRSESVHMPATAGRT